jgi:PadR family transcriptional regulator, regulatory protein AphA
VKGIMPQTEFVILGLLSESPLSGYLIKKYIDFRFRFFWNESYGQIYPTLKSLTRRGLIAEIPPPAGLKRPRKTYQIEPPGMASLKVWLEQPVERESVRLEILLKMYFAHLIEVDVIKRHLAQFQAEHQQDMSILNQFAAELKEVLEKDPNHPYVLRVIECGQKINQAYLDWSRETMKFLDSRKK